MNNTDKLLTVADCENLSIETIKEIYYKHVSPSLTEILSSFSFSDEIITSSEGVWLQTKSGKKILDVTGGAGVLNLGHNPPEILKARIDFQTNKRMEVHKSFFSPYLAALSHNIALVMPGDLNYSYFCNSGAEAVEGAMKIAYKYHGGKKDTILHSNIAFHGKLIASGSLTQTPNSFNFQTSIKKDSFVYNEIASLKEKVRQHSVYAIIVEPFSATHLKGLSHEFLIELREICDRENIILIFDEVYTGWFKTGPLLSFMPSGVIPDIVTVSKTLGGGKSSISAYITRDHVMKKSYGKVKEALLHSSTYNGFAEECITAIESINLLYNNEMDKKAAFIEEKFKKRAASLSEKFPNLIQKISGRGAIQGIFLKSQGGLLENVLRLLPTEMILGEGFVEKLFLAGLIDRLFSKYNIHSLFMTAGTPSLLFSPSLIINEKEIDYFFDSLEDVMTEGASNLAMSFAKKKFKKILNG